MNRTKRRVLGLFAAAAVPMAVASAAFACQSLTTASVSPNSGAAGSAAAVSGCNYSNAAPVQIRWDSQTATPLASATPVNGCVSGVSVTVPANASVGYHAVLITQTVNGVKRSGSPGRASFNVTSGGASSASVLDPSVLVTPVGLAGLALLLGVSRRRRQSAELS